MRSICDKKRTERGENGNLMLRPVRFRRGARDRRRVSRVTGDDDEAVVEEVAVGGGIAAAEEERRLRRRRRKHGSDGSGERESAVTEQPP